MSQTHDANLTGDQIVELRPREKAVICLSVVGSRCPPPKAASRDGELADLGGVFSSDELDADLLLADR
jgi:hypothetical protein